MAYHSKYSGAEVDALLDKIKDDNVGSIDSSLSTTSDNPVQNKVITEELKKKANKTDIATINGQPLTNGGNIEVVTEAYDDTEIKGKLTELAEKVNEKQDTLNAGQGISINQDTKTISCILDTTIFKVVDSLPTSPTSSDENKIHLVLSSSSEEGNTYDEYLWVNNSWEKTGSFRPSVDLSRYAEKSYVDSQIEDEATARTNADVELQTQINGKQDNIDSFSSDEKAAFLVSLGLGKIGVISQKQNWASDYSSYTVSDVVRGIIPQSFIDMALSVGATFNDTDETINHTTSWGEIVPNPPGYFYFVGVGDLSYKEMLDIYSCNAEGNQGNGAYMLTAETRIIRTVKPLRQIMTSTNLDRFALNGKYIENIILHWNYTTMTTGSAFAAFHGCYRLRTLVMSNIQKYIIPSSKNQKMFDYCYSLKTVYLAKLKYSIQFLHSSRLSNESILYMIQNEAATSAITITLHPDAYARAMADADILAALEQHTNISLASA